MAQNSKIEWCDHTVNLWWGCAKVHTGCKNCYAEYFSDTRYKNNLWGENQPRKKIKSAFHYLEKYQAQAKSKGIFYKVFCGSMMDIFEDFKPLVDHKGLPVTKSFHGVDLPRNTEHLRAQLFYNILHDKYPNLIFLLLTKRPGNINGMIPEPWKVTPPKNVWFGTSVSNSDTVKYGALLQQQKLPNTFLSIEPQIGRITHNDLGGLLHSIGWVIQGGESGHNKRPFDVSWAYEMKEICKLYNTPYFFKQIDKVQQIPADLLVKEFPTFI